MSSSGPPELPWLIAASVWIASSMAKLFGAEIWRWRALTMPVVTVCSRPNGLPIAMTPSPTSSCEESASSSGSSTEAGASTSMTATSVDGSLPTTFASYVLPFQKRHLDRLGAVDDVLVRDHVALLVVDEAGALRLLGPPPSPPSGDEPPVDVTAISTTDLWLFL